VKFADTAGFNVIGGSRDHYRVLALPIAGSRKALEQPKVTRRDRRPPRFGGPFLCL